MNKIISNRPNIAIARNFQIGATSTRTQKQGFVWDGVRTCAARPYGRSDWYERPKTGFCLQWGTLLVCLFLFFSTLIIVPTQLFGQWKLQLKEHGRMRLIKFLDTPGPPRIGFVSICSPGVAALYKTYDGGETWNKLAFPEGNLAFGIGDILDLTFKDSLTAWLAANGTGVDGGCCKSTDGGNTWEGLYGPYDGGAVFFDSASDGLFLSNYGYSRQFVSWDEGSTWVAIVEGSPVGYSFFDGNTGVLTGSGGPFPPGPALWVRTTDGGHTWYSLPYDSECWQPLAIPNTKTGFAISDYSGTVSRTDDAWDTWQNLYTFPRGVNQDYVNAVSNGCIRGDTSHLFVRVGSGVYMSTDQGFKWKYLCGQPSLFEIYDERFYAKYPYVYISSFDSATSEGSLWMLNLDSMSSVSSNFSEQFDNGSKKETVQPGDTALVDFLSDTALGPEVGTDSVSMSITVADTSSLSLARFVPSPGWRFEDSSYSNGTYRFLLVCSDSLALASPNKILRGVFASYLTEDSVQSKVYLDSVHLYGHRLNCDCSVESVLSADTSSHTFASALDSVEVDFSGCGDSILLQLMQGGKLAFSIVSIQPNPAQTSITVTLSGVREPGSGDREPGSGIDVEMFDVLGQTILTQHSALSTQHLDVSKVSPGVYFLRLSQGGFAQSRQISIER